MEKLSLNKTNVATNNGEKGQAFFKPIIQPKLSINQPNDIYEQEADAMADKVMRTSDKQVHQPTFFSPAITAVQRKCQHCAEEEKQLHRKESNNNQVIADTSTENYISSLNGDRALTKEERSFFEPRFGCDFSNVQLHTDSNANQSAKSINALAYTHSNHIVFGSNQYQPNTESGQRLMAHELAHVVQQNTNGLSKKVQRFSHTSACTQNDLTNVIWPGDAAARPMVDKVIRVLSTSPGNPLLTPLYIRYFMTATPDTATMLSVYNRVKAAFDANNYTYNCVAQGCSYNGETTTIPLWGGVGSIDMCMPNLNGNAAACIARTIVHEFTHYYARTDDNAYCHSGCNPVGTCPSSLTVAKALDNAGSYGGFAYELSTMSI